VLLMTYQEMIDGLRAAGHDVSGYAHARSAPPVRKARSSVASISIDELAEAIDEAITRYVEPLEARIKELESRPTLRYCGLWEQGREYVPGEFVTCDGSVWACRVATTGKPGVAHSDWQLAVKHGRDVQPRGAAMPRER
jgi:hypothetical protein